MSTLFVKFPPNAEAKAIAYEAECTARLVETFPTETQWAVVRVDQNGNWVVPLYGPPWEHVLGEPVPEPASCAALRVDGVVVLTPEWPAELDV